MLSIFSCLINSVVVDDKWSRFVDESFMIQRIPVYQPVSFRSRSFLRRRSRTSRRCGSTRTCASSATSRCSDIISTESTRFGWNFGFDDPRKKLFELTRFFKFLFWRCWVFLFFFFFVDSGTVLSGPRWTLQSWIRLPVLSYDLCFLRRLILDQITNSPVN